MVHQHRSMGPCAFSSFWEVTGRGETIQHAAPRSADMYRYINVYVHIYIYIDTHIYTRVCIHVYMYTYIYIYIYIYIYTYIYIYLCLYLYLCLYSYLYSHLFIIFLCGGFCCTYIYLYILAHYAYIYIYVCIHVYIYVYQGSPHVCLFLNPKPDTGPEIFSAGAARARGRSIQARRKSQRPPWCVELLGFRV